MAYGDYGKATELEAVNICLAVIGEQPVNTIPSSGVSKATLARDLIYEYSRDVQLEGLLCNTDTELELVRDGSNEIVLPNNCLDVDPVYASDNRYVERNGKLYDTEDKTFTLTKDVTVNIVYFLTWDELPQHVRRFIGIKAARRFQTRYLGDESLHRFTEEDELRTKAQFERKELNNRDFSVLDNSRINPRFFRR